MFAVVDQLDRFLGRFSVDDQFGDAAFQPIRIVDGDFEGRCSEALLDAELFPPCGNARLDEQLFPNLPESEYPLEGGAVHPAR